MAFIAPNPIDDPWYQAMLDSLDRLAEKQPYSLDISTEWFENITYGDSERIFRDLAAKRQVRDDLR